MKIQVFLASALLWAATSQAADPVRPAAQQLATLCSGCSLVTGVATEKRKGKASGVGVAGGAVAGGVVGHKVGDSTLATVGGAVVGGVVGNEIEKRIKRHRVWIVTTKARDGSTAKHEFEQDPQLKAGDVVVAEDNRLRRR